MATASAGLLMYDDQGELSIFLVHPGGPYFKNKDEGWWTIPKGLIEVDEDPLSTARREFYEETNIQSYPPFIQLGQIIQKSGKTVYAWAFAGDSRQEYVLQSNTFSIEWPPKSGVLRDFPEIDQAQWFSWDTALLKIMPAQIPLLQRLKEHLLSP